MIQNSQNKIQKRRWLKHKEKKLQKKEKNNSKKVTYFEYEREIDTVPLYLTRVGGVVRIIIIIIVACDTVYVRADEV